MWPLGEDAGGGARGTSNLGGGGGATGNKGGDK